MKRSLGLLMFSLCLAATVLTAGCARAEPAATYSEFKKIKLGMTYPQVVEVVGFQGRKRVAGERVVGALVPSENDPGGEVYVWMNPNGSNISVKFHQGRAVGISEWDLCNLMALCFRR